MNAFELLCERPLRVVEGINYRSFIPAVFVSVVNADGDGHLTLDGIVNYPKGCGFYANTVWDGSLDPEDFALVETHGMTLVAVDSSESDLAHVAGLINPDSRLVTRREGEALFLSAEELRNKPLYRLSYVIAPLGCFRPEGVAVSV